MMLFTAKRNTSDCDVRLFEVYKNINKNGGSEEETESEKTGKI